MAAYSLLMVRRRLALGSAVLSLALLAAPALAVAQEPELTEPPVVQVKATIKLGFTGLTNRLTRDLTPTR